MQISITELKANLGKYIEWAEAEEIIITRYGKPAAKIVRIDKEPWYLKPVPEKLTSIAQLFGTLPSDIDLDGIRTRRISK